MNLAGIREIVKSKGISEEVILDVVKEILTKAYMKFKGAEEIVVNQELDSNVMEVFILREVVEDESQLEDTMNQVALEDAQKALKKKDIQLKEVVQYPSDPMKDFKEKEILWVSENILNKINLIEKDSIKYEYQRKKNELVTGTIIKKDDYGNIYVDLGNTMAMLPLDNQSPVEHYEVDDMIKAIVVEVEGNRSKRRERFKKRNVQVFLSRSTPELVKELLRMEVPEVSDGIIEIKRISREPGYKTKVAVHSDTIDAVSTCIGPHGIRVTNVVKELGGEKIDIIRYSQEPREMIKHALTPAKVYRIIVENEETNSAFAVVEADQLAYAYGRQKKNVILAARLCGWKINIKTESEIEDEQIEAAGMQELKNVFSTPLSELPLSEELINLLHENNVYSVEQLVEVEEQNSYASLESLEEDQVKIIKEVLSETVEVEDIEESYEEEVVEEEEEWEGTLLSELPDFKEAWIEVLNSENIQYIEELIELSQNDQLQEIGGLSDEDRAAISSILSENVEIEEE